jgi:hypothetical protein
VKSLCTRNKNPCLPDRQGRLIERSQYAPAVEANTKRIHLEKEKYLQRQEIVEHPFGNIKRLPIDIGTPTSCSRKPFSISITTPQT